MGGKTIYTRTDMILDQGRAEGREDGIRIFIEDKLEDGIDNEIICAKLVKRYNLTEDTAKEYIRKYSLSNMAV